jgi:hypothetical protein
MAGAVCVLGLRWVTEAPKTWAKHATVFRAYVLGVSPTCLVSGWRFAPPCCAGQSVCGPLRLHGATAHQRTTSGRHQESSRHLGSSTRATGLHQPQLLEAQFLGQFLGVSNRSTKPLLPNPSLKLSPNGGPPGPASRYGVHFLLAGPGVPPSVPA